MIEKGNITIYKHFDISLRILTFLSKLKTGQIQDKIFYISLKLFNDIRRSIQISEKVEGQMVTHDIYWHKNPETIDLMWLYFQ